MSKKSRQAANLHPADPADPAEHRSRTGRGARALPLFGRAALAAAASLTVLALGLVFSPATPAWAHSRLEHTDPADGATVTSVRGEVTMTFNERIQGRFSTIVVTGPLGDRYDRGHLQVIDAVVHQPVYPLRSGAYTVSWRVISADGHPVDGQFHFTVALPAGQEPSARPPASPTAAPAGGTGVPGWMWPTVVAVLAVAGGVFLLVRGRRRS